MPHPFEVLREIEVEASPEEIWEAIATGRGIDGWFLGVGNEVEPGVGGVVRIDVGGEQAVSTVTAWEPPRRFAYRGDPAPDGSLHAFEYLIEGRGGGRTLVRLVHSGFLGDDWEAEYEALNEGDFMYLHLMAQYVTWFRGRETAVISQWRPEARGRDVAVAALRRGLGLTDTPSEGDPVRFEVDGQPPVEGVLDYVSRSILGVRTDDALYRFLYSPQGAVYLGHHIYRPNLDLDTARSAWEAWLERVVA
jgi:uncharacterized protein YndB with AHSA1/START domain